MAAPGSIEFDQDAVDWLLAVAEEPPRSGRKKAIRSQAQPTPRPAPNKITRRRPKKTHQAGPKRVKFARPEPKSQPGSRRRSRNAARAPPLDPSLRAFKTQTAWLEFGQRREEPDEPRASIDLGGIDEIAARFSSKPPFPCFPYPKHPCSLKVSKLVLFDFEGQIHSRVFDDIDEGLEEIVFHTSSFSMHMLSYCQRFPHLKRVTVKADRHDTMKRSPDSHFVTASLLSSVMAFKEFLEETPVITSVAWTTSELPPGWEQLLRYLRGRENLISLNVPTFPFEDLGVRADSPGLKKLRTLSCTISDQQTLRVLLQKGLRNLRLRTQGPVPSLFLDIGTKVPGLTSLDVWFGDGSAVSALQLAEVLARCPVLKHLAVSSVNKHTTGGHLTNKDLMMIGRRLRAIKHLVLDVPNVIDFEGLERFWSDFQGTEVLCVRENGGNAFNNALAGVGSTYMDIVWENYLSGLPKGAVPPTLDLRLRDRLHFYCLRVTDRAVKHKLHRALEEALHPRYVPLESRARDPSFRPLLEEASKPQSLPPMKGELDLDWLYDIVDHDTFNHLCKVNSWLKVKAIALNYVESSAESSWVSESAGHGEDTEMQDVEEQQEANHNENSDGQQAMDVDEPEPVQEGSTEMMDVGDGGSEKGSEDGGDSQDVEMSDEGADEGAEAESEKMIE